MPLYATPPPPHNRKERMNEMIDSTISKLSLDLSDHQNLPDFRMNSMMMMMRLKKNKNIYGELRSFLIVI